MAERDPYLLYPHDHLVRLLTDLFPSWVRPNHITILRIILTPLVLWLLRVENYDWGVPVFLAVASTDMLDGTLARTRRQITEWGTLYDPVADKILISLVVILIVVQHINIWFGVVMLFLEALLLIGAVVQRRRGYAVHANVWGKTKMILQVTGVTILLAAVWLGVDMFIPVSIGTFSLAIVFAVISLFSYGI